MIIRKVNNSDLKNIVTVHQKCFPDSYSSQLNKYQWFIGSLHEQFFKEFLNDCSEIFLVCEVNNTIVGYCMGYYMDKNDQISNFFKKNRLSLGLKTIFLLLLGNKPTWNKVLSKFDKSNKENWEILNSRNEHILDDERGDLLSICILPEYRGSGMSKLLIDSFLEAMKSQGKKLCLLSVYQDNCRAINYYKKNGFELYRKKGNTSYTFMKLL